MLDALLHVLSGRRVDLVMSDMAPNMSGVDVVDQARAPLISKRSHSILRARRWAPTERL